MHGCRGMQLRRDGQVEDGSCDYLACLGCTDIEACNYAETATTDDGTCRIRKRVWV